MRFFQRTAGPDINSGVREFQAHPGSLLLDVRTPGEYAAGHIPGSINIPLNTLPHSSHLPGRKDCRIFVYCQSGARSQQAVLLLQQMGYTEAENIGGILSWKGRLAG